jgi:hypothetical protein
VQVLATPYKSTAFHIDIGFAIVNGIDFGPGPDWQLALHVACRDLVLAPYRHDCATHIRAELARLEPWPLPIIIVHPRAKSRF